MSLLSALLTQDQVVSHKVIDETIQRQVILGGDFETNLLEIGAIGEDTLSAYCAALHGLPVATREDVTEADPVAIARLPAALAERHQMVALLIDRERLVVAVAAPPLPSSRPEVEAAVRMKIEPRCVVSARLSWALWRYYQVPIAPRIQRLMARVSVLPPGTVPTVTIPLTRPKSGPLPPTPSTSAAINMLSAAMVDDPSSPSSRPPPPDASTRSTAPPSAVAPSMPAAGVEDAPRASKAPELSSRESKPLVPIRTPILRESRPLIVTEPPAELRGAPPVTEVAPTTPGESVVPAAFLASQGADPSSVSTIVPSHESTSPDVQRTAIEASTSTNAPTSEPAAPYSSAVTSSAPSSLARMSVAPKSDTPRRAETLQSVTPVSTPPTVHSVAAPPASPPEAPTEPITLSEPPATRPLPPTQPRRSSSPSVPPAPTSSVPPSLELGVGMMTIPPPGRAPAFATAPRGMSLDEARRLLDEANDRNAVVSTLLDYVHGRFAYCALFIVHADHCVGVEARGEGLTGALLKDRTFSLAQPSVLASAVASGSVEVVAIEDGSIDAEICTVLLRPDVREAVAVPFRMGPKVALVLWADDGSRSPTALAVRNLAQFCTLCAEAFMRVIASRKRSAGARNADARPRASVAPRPRTPDRAARLDALRNAFRGDESATERPSLPETSELPPVQAQRSPPPPEPVGDACERIVQEVQRTGLLTDTALATLVDAGERGLDAVLKYFPGTHRVQRQDSFSKLPPLAEAGPLLRAVVAFRQLALPRLIALLDHVDADQRFCALVCMSDVVHPSALLSIANRLVDTDYPTRMAALEVMRLYRRFDEFEAVGRTLRAVLRDEKSPADQRRAAAFALGELRDVESIPVLVVALGEGDAALAAAAHRALVVIARQDFGALAPPWLDWWEGAARKHRIEWLIDALLHAEPTIRHEASEELKRLTGQHLGYYFNLPRRDRERAHARYVEWWRVEGMQRFAPATGSLAPDPPHA